MMSAFDADASICEKVAMDIARFKVVDPAVESLLGVYLNFKGLHAVAAQRVAHHFWTERGVAGKLISRMLQSETSDVYGVDIHPGVKLGVGITIDHATGVVIGETAELGDVWWNTHREETEEPPTPARSPPRPASAASSTASVRRKQKAASAGQQPCLAQMAEASIFQRKLSPFAGRPSRTLSRHPCFTMLVFMPTAPRRWPLTPTGRRVGWKSLKGWSSYAFWRTRAGCCAWLWMRRVGIFGN